jgi:hypothetical protein
MHVVHTMLAAAQLGGLWDARASHVYSQEQLKTLCSVLWLGHPGTSGLKRSQGNVLLNVLVNVL